MTDEKLERIIENSQGLWKCNVCDKTSNWNSHILSHAETHIQGVKHSCNICMKTYPTRMGVKTHMYDAHSILYSCKICGRTNTNKKALRQSHKRHCDGTPQEQ